MKKLVIIGLATFGLAAGAFAQGGILIDNSAAAEGFVTYGVSGGGSSGYAFYNGTITLEVWYKNSTTGADVAGINAAPWTSPLQGYGAVASAGFTLATTIQNVTVNGGGISAGDLRAPGISGTSPVELALAAYYNTASTGGGTNFTLAKFGGVLAFTQNVNNYVANPTLTDPDLTATGTGPLAGFNTYDLVLAPIPEPATFALAGLGAASLLIFRRRK